MIVYVAEINTDDPSNFFIVDLDKLPDDDRYRGFIAAVLSAVKDENGVGSLDIDSSFSYGDWYEDAIIKPPCNIDATVELYVK